MPKVADLRSFSAFHVCICRGRRHLIMPRLSLLAEGSAPVPFKPFNDCLLSLKGGANLEDKTAPEKSSKSKKIKLQKYVERLISTYFCGFSLYQFRCCDVHRYNEIDTIQRCTPKCTPTND